jgi:hypothetical protein
MSRLQQLAVIRDLILKDLSLTEIATELQSVYDTDALKYSTVSKWRLRFQDGSDDLFDLTCSRRPSRSDLAAPIQSLLQQFPFEKKVNNFIEEREKRWKALSAEPTKLVKGNISAIDELYRQMGGVYIQRFRCEEKSSTTNWKSCIKWTL